MKKPTDVTVEMSHVEIRRYVNKIETVTSGGFSFLVYINMLHYLVVSRD